MATDTDTGVPSLRTPGRTSDGTSDQTLAGLDALDIPVGEQRPLARRTWSATWPKVAAFALFLLLWQAVVWSGWKPTYVLPGPDEALPEFFSQLGTADFWDALGRTLSRAGQGYALAVVIGAAVGLAVARFALLRTAVGSFITALQTMPSIVWFPLAILLFQLSESAIMFVVVLGAAPSVANGVIYGVDYVPPLLVRVGRSMGAKGFALYRHVVAPAALPSVLAGLKQGWAFAWRSLMAGELIVIVPGHPSIGANLQNARDLSDTVGVMVSMLTIFVVGVVVDAVFNALDRRMRQRRGLLAEGSAAVKAARGPRRPGPEAVAGPGAEPGGGHLPAPAGGAEGPSGTGV
ncbi:ABC transporter permease [Frankia sp. R43]|uniref:ABC transporter permease n=1 Tax=Frankia sp. R43 TaxID=269536 RepID=UPI0006CA18AD|nr:ABC transporter permease [Frankia sp. R43]KPM57205.1 ABC transporter permease [Frankia sp. R43]